MEKVTTCLIKAKNAGTALQLADAFACETKVSVLMVDGDGTPLAGTEKSSDFIKVILKTERGKERINHSLASFAGEARQEGKTVIGHCPFTGLLQACVPVCSDGAFLGGWILGQTRRPESEHSYTDALAIIKDIAQEIGLHAYPLKKLLHALPVLSKADFICACSVFEALLAPKRAAGPARAATQRAPGSPLPGQAVGM